MKRITTMDNASTLIGASTLGLVLVITSCERVSFYSTRPAESNQASSASSSTSSASSGGQSSITRGDLLKSIAACHADLLTSFREAAETFESRAAAAKNDPALRNEARIAWQNAIDIWQRAEVSQFGPAGASNTPGGQSMRDHIYSWPLISRCLVEQNIISKTYENADFGSSTLVNMRGLAAAEYLLFYEGTDNACSPATPINANGHWAALDATEIATRKAHYAHAIATAVVATARSLENAWKPSSGDFHTKFINAGAASSVYPTEQTALNAVSDAMFYVEIAVKDLKLARPLGLMDCDDVLCPDAVESRFAGRSRTHIRNNLVGFRILMTGCDAGPTGFDDILSAVGASALAAKMNGNVELAIAAADAVPEDDLAKALVSSPESVLNLHAAVKRITDLLKTEFVSVLDLELPQTVEGDND